MNLILRQEVQRFDLRFQSGCSIVFRFSDSIFSIFQRYSSALYRFSLQESIDLGNSKDMNVQFGFSWKAKSFIHTGFSMFSTFYSKIVENREERSEQT